MSYDPFFTRKTTISEKNSLTTPFLLCSYFRAHPTTLLLKILRERMHGPSPTSHFCGGPSPQSSLGLRLWLWTMEVRQTETRSIGLRVSSPEFLFNRPIHKSFYF